MFRLLESTDIAMPLEKGAPMSYHNSTAPHPPHLSEGELREFAEFDERNDGVFVGSFQCSQSHGPNTFSLVIFVLLTLQRVSFLLFGTGLSYFGGHPSFICE